MTKFFRISVIALLFSVFSILSTACASWQTSINSVESQSRYIFDMKDANNVHYMVYIFSNNETQSRAEVGTWFTPGHIVYKGNYQVALVPQNTRSATVQDVSLFGLGPQDTTSGVFDTIDPVWRNSAYVVQSQFNGQPDVLVVTQRVAASGAIERAFYIDGGVLNLAHWQSSNGIVSKSTDGSGKYILTCSDFLTYKTQGYARSMEYTGPINNVWKLDLSRRTFILLSTILPGRFGQ